MIVAEKGTKKDEGIKAEKRIVDDESIDELIALWDRPISRRSPLCAKEKAPTYIVRAV